MSERFQLKPRKRSYPDGVRLHRQLPDGSIEYLESFKDQDEMLRAMSVTDEQGRCRYDSDEAFRDAVIALIHNTPPHIVGVELTPRSPIPTDEEMLRGLREDAIREEFDALIDTAGGNNARAKLQLAQHLMNPSDEVRQVLTEMGQLTQLDESRPMESYLKDRQANGLGPDRQTVSMIDEEEDARKEAEHNQEILNWMASQDTDGDVEAGGGEGVGV